jgi:hypothetical protein
MIFRRLRLNQQFPFYLVGVFLSTLLTIAITPILTGASAGPDFDFIEAFDVEAKVFPRGFVYTPIVILLWLRGYTIGKNTITPIGVSLQMRLGILIYFILALVGSRQIQDDMLTLLPLFFGCALMGTALARAATLHIEEEVRQHRFGLSWLGFISVVVIALVVSGFFLSLVLAGVDRDKVFEALVLVGAGLITIIFILATPFLWLGQQIVTWLQSVLTDEPVEQSVEGGQRAGPQAAREVDRLEYGEILETVLDVLAGGTLVVMVGVVVVSLVVFIGILILGREDDQLSNESSENIDNRELIGGIRKAFGNQWKKLTDALSTVRKYGLGRNLMGVLTIRWAYARMESEARKRGYPRGKSQTPYEYRKDAAKAYPTGEDYIRTLTDAYVAIRYGDVPESREALDKVRHALDQLMTIEPPV